MRPTLFFFFISIGVVASQSAPCNNESFRAFDFWIGEWVVSDTTGNVVGFNHIYPILNDCVLLENWTGAGPSRGKSINHYDWASGSWKQKWVDNFGTNLEFTGELEKDRITYSCESINPSDRSSIYNVMVISKIHQDQVLQVWRQSTDSISWKEVFVGVYDRLMNTEDHPVHKEIESVYSLFSESYQTYNDSLTSSLYVKDAMYLSGNGSIVKGRDEIRKIFKSFFESQKSKNVSMSIDFKIKMRDIAIDRVHDVGYYVLTINDRNNIETKSIGKFSAVFKRSHDSTWKFLSDTSLPAPKE